MSDSGELLIAKRCTTCPYTTNRETQEYCAQCGHQPVNYPVIKDE